MSTRSSWTRVTTAPPTAAPAVPGVVEKTPAIAAAAATNATAARNVPAIRTTMLRVSCGGRTGFGCAHGCIVPGRGRATLESCSRRQSCSLLPTLAGSAASAAGTTTVPVIHCPTTYGVSQPPPRLPGRLSVSAGARAVAGLDAYSEWRPVLARASRHALSCGRHRRWRREHRDHGRQHDTRPRAGRDRLFRRHARQRGLARVPAGSERGTAALGPALSPLQACGRVHVIGRPGNALLQRPAARSRRRRPFGRRRSRTRRDRVRCGDERG